MDLSDIANKVSDLDTRLSGIADTVGKHGANGAELEKTLTAQGVLLGELRSDLDFIKGQIETVGGRLAGYITSHAAILAKQAQHDAEMIGMRATIAATGTVAHTTFLEAAHATFARLFPNVILPHPRPDGDMPVIAPSILTAQGAATADQLIQAGAEPDKVATNAAATTGARFVPVTGNGASSVSGRQF